MNGRTKPEEQNGVTAPCPPSGQSNRLFEQGANFSIAPKGKKQKKAPEVIQGLLAGSSWLLHIKQMYIENQNRRRRDRDVLVITVFH